VALKRAGAALAVRIRTTCSRSTTKILPSPTLPVPVLVIRFDHPLSEDIVRRDFDLCFWHELDEVLGAPINLGVAALPPKASDLGNRNALDAPSPTALRTSSSLCGLMMQ